MAANLKSTLITNRDASPKVLTDSFISGGQASGSYGWVYTGGTDAAGSAYRLCSVPSNARLSNLEYIGMSLGSGCFVDVAAWYPTNIQSGGGNFLAQSLAATLISSSAFEEIASVNTATFTTCMTTATTALSPQYLEMPLWQLLGLATDPEIPIDLGFSVRVAVATAGYVGLKASYQY